MNQLDLFEIDEQTAADRVLFVTAINSRIDNSSGFARHILFVGDSISLCGLRPNRTRVWRDYKPLDYAKSICPKCKCKLKAIKEMGGGFDYRPNTMIPEDFYVS